MHWNATAFDPRSRPNMFRCGLCGATSNSFELIRSQSEISAAKNNPTHSYLPEKVIAHFCICNLGVVLINFFDVRIFINQNHVPPLCLLCDVASFFWNI